MANVNHLRERVRALEITGDQRQTDIERLYEKLRSLPPLQNDVAKLLAWRLKINTHINRCIRWALAGAGLVGLRFASEPWATLLQPWVGRLIGH